MENVEVKVLGAFPFSFTDDKTGRLVEGTTVWFHEINPSNDERGIGFKPTKATLPLHYFDKFKNIALPTICKVETTTQFTSRGITTKIADFVPVKK